MATVEALKEKKDIELMKTVLKERNIRHYLLFVMGCNTGLRIGDILRLKVSYFIANGKLARGSKTGCPGYTGGSTQTGILYENSQGWR